MSEEYFDGYGWFPDASRQMRILSELPGPEGEPEEDAPEKSGTDNEEAGN